MAAQKKQSPAMEFLVESLKKDKTASYADLKAKADEKKLVVYPIMFGRAQALLGIVKRGHGQTKMPKAKAAKAAGGAAPAKRGRGRPANASSKSGQVRALLGTGMSPSDIAAKVGCTTALVYNIKSKGGGAPAKRGPGRPRKAAAAGLDGIAGIVAMVQSGERERGKMRAELERIQVVIADVLA